MSKTLVNLFITQDGFIATPLGDTGWIPPMQNKDDLEIFGLTELLHRIDTILIGHNTYLQALDNDVWNWSSKKTYVFSTKTQISPNSMFHFTNSSPEKFMDKFGTKGKDIWLMGGAKLIKSFDEADLIDEITLNIIPITLQKGIKLELFLDQYHLESNIEIYAGILQQKYTKKTS